jgi:hypothetical protein
MVTPQDAADVLTAAGHTRWASLDDPHDQPRFVAFTSHGRVLVGLNLAVHHARSVVLAQYLAALADAGLPARLCADGYIQITEAAPR